ncbi:MAG: prolipoprotein diacylglyceryl transferase [Christensenellaceae bacterium]|jgi:phosphatidylglycerol:prolipoprotein diacylglycerol transferase|nr:prolipoprotein diacylglyceryl transferase [Christensenellaceae bacterium]
MFVPSNIAFTLFGRPIFWYGILVASAVLLGILLAAREAKRREIEPDSILDLALLTIPLAIVFARLYYVAFEWPRYASDPWSILYIWQGGIAVYGSIIGGLIALLIFAKWRKIGFWTLADIAVPSLVLGQAIGRWGNFFNQEAYGRAISDPSLQWFPFAVYIQALENTPQGPWHYATFFYESVSCFVIFALLYFVFRKRVKQDGNLFLIYLLLYGVERAFVEGLRTDSLYLYLGDLAIRVSQALSIVLVIVSALMLYLRHRKAVYEASVLDPNLIMRRGEEEALSGEFSPLEETEEGEEIGEMPEEAAEIEAEREAEGKAESQIEKMKAEEASAGAFAEGAPPEGVPEEAKKGPAEEEKTEAAPADAKEDAPAETRAEEAPAQGQAPQEDSSENA